MFYTSQWQTQTSFLNDRVEKKEKKASEVISITTPVRNSPILIVALPETMPRDQIRFDCNCFDFSQSKYFSVSPVRSEAHQSNRRPSVLRADRTVSLSNAVVIVLPALFSDAHLLECHRRTVRNPPRSSSVPPIHRQSVRQSTSQSTPID